VRHQLAALVKTRLKRMQYWPGLIDGFLAKTGLDLTPLVTSTIEEATARVKLLRPDHGGSGRGAGHATSSVSGC
jgi:hypothetical protein